MVFQTTFLDLHFVTGQNSSNFQIEDTPPLDTVGAVCLDNKGGVSGGVSSGGISLKFPGRVGQAAVYGCGCWAQHDLCSGNKAIACSTSGEPWERGKRMWSLSHPPALQVLESTL